MKRLLCLLLALALLPVLSLAEGADDLEIEEIIEDIIIDENGNEILVDEDTGEAFILSETQQEELEALDETIDTSVDPDSLELNPNLPDHVINILLLGTDGRDARYKTLKEAQEADGDGDSKGIRQRADVWMIVSIDTQNGTIKLSSLLRDIYLSVPGYKSKTKITNIFDYTNREGNHGANAELCMRTLNHHFELNIQNYIAINFYGLASIIDSIGGVDIDLTKAEAKAINTYLKKNANKIAKTYDTKAKGERVSLKAENGVQHLDGVQAVMYARLRHTTSTTGLEGDFGRTERQRHLMEILLQSVMADISVDKLLNLVGTSIDYASTNMNVETMFNLALQMIPSIVKRLGSEEGLVEQFRIPLNKTYTYETIDGASVVFMSSANLQKNKEALHEFIYGAYLPAE